mgnify:CR=1 FL=1
MRVIAAAASASSPLSGQKARSSANLQLLSNDGSTITVSGPPCVLFNISEDVRGSDPTPVSNATNRTTFDGSKLQVRKNYYSASPSNAHARSAVVLSQS